MNKTQNKLSILMMVNFGIGLIVATDLFLPTTNTPLLGLIMIYILSILLFISGGMIDYQVYKYGLEKGILLKGEKR